MNHDDRDDDLENDSYDDFDDFDERGGMMRWLSVVFVVAALGGFVALAWYAYQSGMQPVSEDEIPMVAAEPDPFKEKPEDPGGLQFEHQDKSVYNQLATGDGAGRAVAERLLPPPEEPVERPQPVEPLSPEDMTNGQAQDSTAPTETIVETPFPSTPAKGDGASVEVVEVTKEPVTQEPAAQEPAAAAPAVEAPADEGVQKTQTKPAPAPVETTRQKAPEPASAATATPVAGQYMVQLGAFSSQDDAVAAWDKIRAAHGSMFPTKTYKLQRADVNGKTFHRLQVGPFESDTAARKVCEHLQKNSQPCFPVSVK